MGKNKELAINTAIITIGKLCTQFLSFLLLPLYTSVLSTSEYGTVDLLITYQQLIACIIFFQIEQAIFRFLIEVRGKKEETSTILSSCFIFAFLQAVILGVILGVFSAITKYSDIGYLYAYVVAVILSGLMLQTARGIGKNAVYAFGSFISAISIIALNIVFLIVFKFGVEGLLLSYILGNLLSALSVFIILKVHQYFKISKISGKQMKNCLIYSLPLVPNAMSWWIMSASDRTIVALFLGTSFNGLLTVAHKFPSAYSAFYTVFNLSWTESASLHIGDDDAEEFFANVIHRVFRLFSSAAIGIVACMPFVFRILVNHSYADAYYQIPIYIIAAVCQMFQGLYSVIYVALKKTKEVAKSTIVAALINIIINISLIKIIGLYSASISTFIAYLFLCVWRYFDLKKYLNVKFDIKLLVSSIFIFAIICIGYYLGDTPIRIMCLIVAIMYSVYINRNILKLILQSPSKLKKIITSKK